MTLTASEIQALINALPARMTEAGLRLPKASLEFRANGLPGVSLQWQRLTGVGHETTAYRWFPADTAQEAIDAAVRFVTEFPAAE